jgi:hypothetical protein
MTPNTGTISINSFEFIDNMIINTHDKGMHRYIPVTPCEETENHYEIARCIIGRPNIDVIKFIFLIIDMGLFKTFTKLRQTYVVSHTYIIKHVCEKDNVDFLIHGISDIFPYFPEAWTEQIGLNNSVKCFKYLCEKGTALINETVKHAFMNDSAGIIQIAVEYGFRIPTVVVNSEVVHDFSIFHPIFKTYDCYITLQQATNMEISEDHKYLCIRSQNVKLLKYMMDNTPSDHNDIINWARVYGDIHIFKQVNSRNTPLANDLINAFKSCNYCLFEHLITLIDQLPPMTPDFFEHKKPDCFIRKAFQYKMPLTEEAHEFVQKNMPRKWLNEVYYDRFPERKPTAWKLKFW